MAEGGGGGGGRVGGGGGGAPRGRREKVEGPNEDVTACFHRDANA